MASVNKYGLNPEVTAQIEAIAGTSGLSLAGNVPFDSRVAAAMVQGQTVLEYHRKGPATAAVRSLWLRVSAHLGLTARSICE